MPPSILIRDATEADLPVVGSLAASLVRMHHAADPDRFLLVDGVEEGYRRWLAREMKRDRACVLVASMDERVVGYTYATLEERDWNMLLDAHGAIQDIFVASDARRLGIGRRLVEATVAALRSKGAPRVVLSTMYGNHAAQALFRACGFRPTMIEMTL